RTRGEPDHRRRISPAARAGPADPPGERGAAPAIGAVPRRGRRRRPGRAHVRRRPAWAGQRTAAIPARSRPPHLPAARAARVRLTRARGRFTGTPSPATSALMNDLLSTAWLADRLGEPGVVVVDASAHLPDAGRDARAEFEAAHIPGARFLELETLKHLDSPVPAARRTAAQFAARMAEIGVDDGGRVVSYDDSGVKTSARSCFIVRMHGLEQVAILAGGLGKWRAEGRPLEAGSHSAAPGTVRPR